MHASPMSVVVPVALALAVLSGAVSCAASGPAAAPGSEMKQLVETRLFFGASLSDGSVVSAKDWERFLDDEVTRRFPDGLTVFSARGEYRDAATGIAFEEDTRVLCVVHEDTAESDKKLAEIAALYSKRFKQLSVLRLDGPVTIRFYEGTY